MNQYKAIFDSIPLPALLIRSDAPDFTIIEVNDALYSILLNKDQIVRGRPFFEIFPGDPADPDAPHAEAVLKSLIRVIETGKTDKMGVIHIQETVPDTGDVISRYYDLTNIPLDEGLILHTVQNVTEQINQKMEIARQEKHFRALVENGSDVLLILSAEGKPTYASPSIKNVLGYSQEEALRFDITTICHPDDIPIITKEFGEALQHPGEAINVTPARMRHKDGNWRWFEGTITNMLHDPAIGGIVDNFRDVTENVKTREKLERTYELAKIGTWELNLITNELSWSRYVRELHEVPDNFEPDLNSALGFYKKGRNRRLIQEAVEEAIESGKRFDLELEVISAKGNHRWIRATGQAEHADGRSIRVFGVTQDISERMQARAAMAESLQEKETLLSEIHHRVKNNLAIVSSLMELQSMNAEDERLQTQLMEGILRIKSMAGIHEQLYQEGSYSRIKLSDSLKLLTKNVINALSKEAEANLQFDMDEVEAGLVQAVPCSLLVNEVVTNSVKHAFGSQSENRLSVTLKESGEQIRLTVIDNGPGLPDHFLPEEATSMGMQLIRVLTEQLYGEFTYSNHNPGTRFELSFRKGLPAYDDGNDPG